jgi:hypothetical protein
MTTPPPATTLHGEFFHNVDFPAIIRRFALMQADILASRPTELKSAVRTVRNGFIQPTETGISDVSDGVKRACAYAREKSKTKSFKIEKHIEAPLVDLCGRLAVRNVRTCPNPIERVISEVSDFAAIAAAIRKSHSVALDLETYGPRKGDGLDPWAGDIRLLSLCVEGHEPWILDLRAIGYDLGEMKTALESVEIIAHNAKFDLLWLRVKCGLRATRVFCTLVAARLLSAGTKPGNDLDGWLSYFSVVFKGCLRDIERLRDGFRSIHPRASHRRARGLFADQCGLCALSPAQRGQHLIYRLLVHRLNVECPQGTGAAEGMSQAPQTLPKALKRELV